MLGIIIGTATIILVVAVGLGSKKSVDNQFSQMSVTTIYVMASSTGSPIPSKLGIKDVAVIKENCPSVAAVAPQISGKAAASAGVDTESVTVLGVTEDYQSLTNLKLSSGSFLTPESVTTKEKIAVLGADIADTLFGDAPGEIVGQMININKKKFIVGGVIERKGETLGSTNIDEGVFIPYTTAQSYVLGTTITPRLTVQAKDLPSVKPALSEITAALREAHKLRPDMADDFRAMDAGSKVGAAQETARTMSVLLIAIATIVLVVGGIGIMNVMLVSVRERTKEIGTRRALGARKKDVLRQFLFEAIGISVFGGLLGVGLGEVVIPLLKYLEIEAIRSMQGLLIAFAFSGIVGIFFGFYPATKAADSNPIEALRYE
ncbi:Macrolide export ATP-binding/permease protein MacB [Desulfosporosinus metallidurans]|uniref:Macrolide export ATP-binding/permease protein MacB n=2 Tax=Desulfosporosinus metallidurans TaxID=1888891 RepID=A0A1Q8R087_9FIRM|nr:Macrolide export ATP-binding/permease protein MacB [Desulfosporosinus metallidurans]